MNYRLIARYHGYLAFAIAFLMTPSLIWAIRFGEADSTTAIALSIATSAIVGASLMLLGRRASATIWQREVLILISFSWIFAAIMGATPFIYAGLLSPLDAFFESMSGFTTTGSTVIPLLDEVPRSMLFWRATTQWAGGAASILLLIAILPYIDAGGNLRFRSEAITPDVRTITPRVRDTAAILYKTYIGLTLILVIALTLAGMSLYEALAYAMTTISSGGFTLSQAGISAYDSPLIEAIVMVGMLAAGTSFVLIFTMVRGDWFAPLRDLEWRTYISLAAGAIILITLYLVFAPTVGRPDHSISHAARISAFQTISILTTTGFIVDTPHLWPTLPRVILFLVLFTGACAASTAGGVKILRILIGNKTALWRLENTFRPKTIRAIRISGQVVDDNTRRSVNSFFVVFTAWLVFGSLVMASLGLPFEAALAAVAANLNNAGPALALASETYHYAEISALGKIVLAITMLAGRLELLAICVLVIPAFWKHS